jgi:hypothetical protein
VTGAVGAAAALVLSVVLLGCGNSSDDSGLASLPESLTSSAASDASASAAASRPTPSSAPVTAVVEAPPDPSTEDEDVVSAYRAFWESYAQALGTGDVPGSGLYNTLLPPEVIAYENSITEQTDQQVYGRGEYRIAVTSVDIQGPSAVVQSCLDQAGAWDEGPDGQRTPAAEPRSLWHANLVMDGPRWVVQSLETPDGSC